MRLLTDVLRVYSYVFETVLCVGGVLLSGFVLRTPHVGFSLPWLPWTGSHQIFWILGASVIGLLCVLTAVMRWTRWLLFLFSGAIFFLLAKGLFINTQYVFSGKSAVHNALLLATGALLAFFGSAFVKRYRR